MVRSRIGSPPSEAAAAFDETLAGTVNQAHARGRLCPPTHEGGGVFGALFDRIVPRLCERTVDVLRQALRSGSLTLGCLLALGGGCGEGGPRVDVSGVVLDDHTGAPIAGARVSTDDGLSAETDDDGRFELSVEGGDDAHVTATAVGHAPARERIASHRGADELVIRLTATSVEATDARPSAPPRRGAPALSLDEDAKLRVDACAPCHSEVSAEWARSSMGDLSRGLDAGDPALRSECASCHSAQSFVANREGRESTAGSRSEVAAITCGACHDGHAHDGAFALRVDDTSEPIAGVEIPHLGAGALCASCHRATGDAIDAAPHAPQADVLVGRGARFTDPVDDGAHRHIAETCARCHMARPHESDLERGRVGGHTFAVRAPDATMARSACSPCHGEVPPATIAARDWNGDGLASSLFEEHSSSMSAARGRIRRSIRSLRVHDTCDDPQMAADVTDHDARLHLIDADGRLLGDCDGDGRLSGSETGVTTSALPRELAELSYDVLLLERDGSFGAHNPRYSFAILGAVNAELR